jgi:hypothetical protein
MACKKKARELKCTKLSKKHVKQLTSSSLNLPALHILSNSSPPAAYSITIAKCVGVKITYKITIKILFKHRFNWFELRVKGVKIRGSTPGKGDKILTLTINY